MGRNAKHGSLDSLKYPISDCNHTGAISVNVCITPTYLKAKALSFRMVQCIAKMRLGWHCLAIHTGRYNGIVRDDRVCRLCQKLGYRDDTTGSVPVEDLVHFMLDCRVLHPVRDDFPLFFKPASLPGQSKDSHVKFMVYVVYGLALSKA